MEKSSCGGSGGAGTRSKRIFITNRLAEAWASVEGELYAFMPIDTAAAPAHIAKTDACAEQLTGNE